jgi:hypothetical protein
MGASRGGAVTGRASPQAAGGAVCLRSTTMTHHLDPPANWLPAPDGPFTVVIRVYGPSAAVLDGDWRPPPLDPAN